MQKSKLGLPASIAAAIMYMTGLFGGYVAALLAAGFILLVEDENFIRRAAVKTLIILFAFSVLNVLIYLIPDASDVFPADPWERSKFCSRNYRSLIRFHPTQNNIRAIGTYLPGL